MNKKRIFRIEHKELVNIEASLELDVEESATPLVVYEPYEAFKAKEPAPAENLNTDQIMEFIHQYSPVALEVTAPTPKRGIASTKECNRTKTFQNVVSQALGVDRDLNMGFVFGANIIYANEPFKIDSVVQTIETEHCDCEGSAL